MRRSSLGRGYLIVLAAIAYSTSWLARADATSELDDAAARIQYAFYTANARELEQVLSLLSGIDATAVRGLKEYYAAYGNWKLAQVHTEAGTGKTYSRAAGRAIQECERQAKAAVAADPRMAEAFAIGAICGDAGSMFGRGDCSASKGLQSARQLDPQSPRVRLIEVMCASADTAGPGTLQKLRSVVDAFESAPPSRPGKPDWGHAEALLLLGQSYLERGDALAARDAIERALAIAPDYRKAQRLLQAAAGK